MRRQREDDDIEGKEDVLPESSAELMPDVLHIIFGHLHVSDQLMLMVVSQQWREVVIPVIVDAYIDMTAIEQREDTTEGCNYTFWRNNCPYSLFVSTVTPCEFWIRIAGKRILPYGIPNGSFGPRWDIRVPIDKAVYYECRECRILSRKTKAVWPGIDLCSSKCMEGTLCDEKKAAAAFRSLIPRHDDPDRIAKMARMMTEVISKGGLLIWDVSTRQ
jgi:hypothetical protein